MVMANAYPIPTLPAVGNFSRRCLYLALFTFPLNIGAQTLTIDESISVEEYDNLLAASRHTARRIEVERKGEKYLVYVTPYIVAGNDSTDSVIVHRSSGYVQFPHMGTYGYVDLRRGDEILLSSRVNFAPSRLHLDSLEAGEYEVTLSGCSDYRTIWIRLVD